MERNGQVTYDDPQQAKAWEVYQRLVAAHGERPLTPRRAPMRELISTMLSHRTTHKNEELAYTRMWQQFGTWEAIRDAPLDALTQAISPATFPEVKAPNIQAVLRQIIAERGEASIDFLRELRADQGLQWLMALPGVGMKTASLVLLFCFAKPVIPVDTHVHRVSQRLGLIGPKVNATTAHAVLLGLLPSDPLILYNFHVRLLRHGQQICVWGTPRCAQCILTDRCDWYGDHHPHH